MPPMRHSRQAPRERRFIWTANWPLLILVLGALLVSISVPTALAQTDDSNAIRVQSNEVLVPVMVLDKKRLAQLRSMNPFIFRQEAHSGDFRAWDRLAVGGLTARDFRVFEDGREQFIERVNELPRSGPPLLRDNFGHFWDFLGVGRGIWTVQVSVPAAGSAYNILPALPGYLVGYTPPSSPDGSCHQISVKTTRPELLVYSRHEYCDTQISAADPLKGTKLGKRLVSDLASAKKTETPLSITAFAPLTSARSIPVQVYLDFPSKPLVLAGEDCGEAVKRMIGLLGAVYTDSGNLVARFSDFASQGTDSDHSFGPLLALLPNPPGTRCTYDEPARYRTEIPLPAGKYDIRVVLREGKKLGRAEILLTIENSDPAQLALSEIAVIRRFRDVAAKSQGTATSLPENFAPLLSGNFEVTPAADTRFRAGDPFYFYLQVYEPQHSGAPLSAIEVRLRILDADTGKTISKVHSLDATKYAVPGDPVTPIAGGIDISKLPKGSYQLQAQAIDSTGATTPWRSVTFTIE
jgi:hypothetical protein